MTMRTYLNQSIVNFNYNLLGSGENDIKFADISLPLHIQIYDDGLPDDLNEFYQLIRNDKLSLMFKLFKFRSYTSIIEDYKTHSSNKLLIGCIYQGMGFNVSLYYDIKNMYYFFIEQGGNSYLTCSSNEENLNWLGPITVDKQFHKIKDCFDLINNINCKYLDDMMFLHSAYLVN